MGVPLARNLEAPIMDINTQTSLSKSNQPIPTFDCHHFALMLNDGLICEVSNNLRTKALFLNF